MNKIILRTIKSLLFFLNFLFIAVLLNADTIYFKDGNQIQGDIINETQDSITIKRKIGGVEGTSTHSKSEISKIQKLSEAEKMKRKQEEERKYIEEISRKRAAVKRKEKLQEKMRTYASNRFDYAISFVKRQEYLVSEEGYRIDHDIGKVFIIIGVHFFNGSQEKEFCSPGNFVLIDSDNTPYDCDSSTFSVPFGLESVDLYPGTKKEGVIVFQILSNRSPVKLIYEVRYDSSIEKNITYIE